LEIAPVITAICRQSLELGTLPCDWKEAIISPVYKKGNVHLASNYRPVSLTCVISKIMEHMICKHIHNHLEKCDILTSFQHGFRKAHSCETPLLLTVDDRMRSFDQKIQSDIAILDFSRAFDTVPHERLLGKLGHYGIRGPIHNWIRAFLYNRQMWVAVDGESCCKARVASGVPSSSFSSMTFPMWCHLVQPLVSADDCLVYREIKTGEDQVTRDLSALVTWEKYGVCSSTQQNVTS